MNPADWFWLPPGVGVRLGIRKSPIWDVSIWAGDFTRRLLSEALFGARRDLSAYLPLKTFESLGRKLILLKELIIHV